MFYITVNTHKQIDILFVISYQCVTVNKNNGEILILTLVRI